MRGGMTGVGMDEKENTPRAGKGKKGKERRRSSQGGSARRLSISGSNPRLHYLKVTNRFQRKGGFGRGRITAHRPVQFDGSPFEFSLRSDSDGDRRKSFVVFEDDVDSLSYKSRQPESATELVSTGKILPVFGSKNAAVENCRAPMPQGTREIASRAPGQQESEYHVTENFVAFRARNESLFSANLRPRPVASPVEHTNQQESGARPSLEEVAARWRRGGKWDVFTQRSLDTSELEELEQTIRKMDEEDLEREMHENYLEMEMRKYDLENVMQPIIQRDNEELFVPVETSEAHETVMVPVEEQANVGELAPEALNTQEWELLSPRTGGLEINEEAANVDLATPMPSGSKEKLRLDQEATPVILDLGISPEASDIDRAITQSTPAITQSTPAIKQLTPTIKELTPATKQPTSPASLLFSGCNDQDLDALQGIPAEAESKIAQTVEAVQVWSVELDPSRRRRETMEYYDNRRSPWMKSLVLSSFQSANQLPDDAANNLLRTPTMPMDYFDRVTPFNVTGSLAPLKPSECVLNGPSKNLVESYEGGFLSTNLPSSSGEDLNGKEGDAEPTERRLSTCPDHSTANECDEHVPLTENGRDMQALKETMSEATRRNSWSSWPDQSPVIPIDLSAECVEGLHEKTSESSLEPPSLQSTEPLRRIDDVTTTPHLAQSCFSRITSPTPPRNLSLFFGKAFGQMSNEELNRRWLQFCLSPPVFQDAIAGKKKSWNVESASAEPTCSDPTSFPSEQVLQRNTEADVLPIAEEEAVSSDGVDRNTSRHDEHALPNAEEEALSSDGSDGVMDYENDFDDLSNNSTRIVQAGAPSADNDQEGTSALKECPPEDAQDALFGEEMRCINVTPIRDNTFAEATAGLDVEYSLAHIDEEHIDQFVNSLQVTPGVDESCVERPTYNGGDVSRDSTVIDNCQSPGDEARQPNLNKELSTPPKGGNNNSVQAQDECTPVQQKSKPKRTRKSTRIKKVDSPLDAGSKWSNGQRMSTRIRSKPLDWWRGERMLYGRVHSSLNTLIGIKHLSPDPAWPRPRNGKNKIEPPKFKVDSFVSEEHKELLRLAAQ